MQKTRLGVTVGVLGAAMFFIALFGGYVATIVLAGYILLFEENMWLKKSAAKAAALLIAFSLLNTLIGLIPGVVGTIDDIANIFGQNVIVPYLSRIITVITDIINIAEKVLFIILGVKAFRQRTLPIPLVDDIVIKYVG